MDFGDAEFVLSIVALALSAGVIKAAIRARYGQPLQEHPRGNARKRNRGEIETLRVENSRLIERVESYEERIAVLERIVTDSSYRLGNEIESLRDKESRLEDGRKTQ